MQFDKLPLDARILENLKSLKFTDMTPVQAQVLPHALDGKDILAQAQTGSGKTAAFGLPLLNKLKQENLHVQALIMCPTRELAEQVAQEMRNLSRLIPDVKILTITGGRNEYQQEKSLSHGAHIIVGTPGRVRRLLKKESLKIDRVVSYVLDEADRMLDMGFEEDLNYIESFLSQDRQTLLFSATFPENIKELSKSILKNNSEEIIIESAIKKDIKEEFYEVMGHEEKFPALLFFLNKYKPQSFIVFCKTKIIADKLASDLEDTGLMVESIHGDMDQKERDMALNMFSNNSLSGLVATDVAARGLDIKGVDLVFNFDITKDPEVYVHRIGRTGRAGESGLAISFITSKQFDLVDSISNLTGNDFEMPKFDQNYELDFEYPLPKYGTLFIFAGKRDKLRPGDIVGALVGEAQLDATDVGNISITPNSSYVAVLRSKIEQVEDAFIKDKIKIKKRNFRAKIVL